MADRPDPVLDAAAPVRLAGVGIGCIKAARIATAARALPPLPRTGEAREVDGCWTVGVSPREWLLLARPAAALAPRLAAVAAAAGTTEVAAVDLSDAFVPFAVPPALAATVVADGCGPGVAPLKVGQGLRTRLARIPAVLTMPPGGALWIAVARAHAAYLALWLDRTFGLSEGDVR